MTNFEIYTYLKSKNGGGEPVPGPVTNPVLRLMDWEGTVLKEYTAEQVASLTALPNPSNLNTNVDRELLTFQGYNWALADIKTWVTTHEGQCLTVGAIYTTTDGQDHNYWNNPRLTTTTTISKRKRGMTSIGNNAFSNCYSLTSINLPDGVTSIGDSAFSGCVSLTNINIPDSVTRLWGSAFRSCYSLTNVNIPDSVTSIGASAFNSCYSLTSINLPDSVTSIGDSAFDSCYSLTSINLPDSVTSIGSNAFYYCRSLTNVNISDSVTSIGASAFSGCSCLTDIAIKGSPDSVTTIGSNAFSYCRSLTNVNIPDSVTTIGASAFSGCSCLTDIVIHGKPALANINAFDNTYDGLRIYVPREYLSWYSTATNWDVFYDDEMIVAIEDYIEYLASIGIDVSEYEEEQT